MNILSRGDGGTKWIRLWVLPLLTLIGIVFGAGMSWAFLKTAVGRNTIKIEKNVQDIESLKKVRIDIARINGNIERIDEKLDLLMRFAVIKGEE